MIENDNSNAAPLRNPEGAKIVNKPGVYQLVGNDGAGLGFCFVQDGKVFALQNRGTINPGTMAPNINFHGPFVPPPKP